MARRKRRERQKKSGDKQTATQVILLITAILQLINVLIDLIRKMIQ